MTNKKTILVTGATGAQGGSVAQHLLKKGAFNVRGLTRDASSEKASALRQAGAQIVTGNLADTESLRVALTGADGVFGVTNFWEHFEKEREHGRNLIEAVAEAGIRDFVFSSLPPAKKISGGEFDVPHFDIKADLEDLARRLIPGAIFVHVSFYYENFLNFLPPQKQADGSFAFGFPQGDTKLAAVSVEEIGGVIAEIFERPDEFRGRTIGIVGDNLPPAEYAAAMTKHLGQTVRYNHIPREVFASFGFPGAEDLANMFDINRRVGFWRESDLATTRRLFPPIRTFEAWLAANKNKFSNMG